MEVLEVVLKVHYPSNIFKLKSALALGNRKFQSALHVLNPLQSHFTFLLILALLENLVAFSKPTKKLI